MVDIGSGGGLFCLEGSFPSRSHRVAVFPGIFCPHGRWSRFNELPRFLNKLFRAFADLLPGIFA
jgi:hypothetical protein